MSLKDEEIKVSIIVPCLNEKTYIEKVLDSIVAQTFPHERIEVLVVDGMSNDGTREIIKEYSSKYPFIKIVDNPRQITPIALNIGIEESTGDIIVILGAHSLYHNSYVENLVNWLMHLKAEGVGVASETLPSDNSLKAKAIALALSHPFGVGNSLFRIKDIKEPIEVDTIPFGCYWKKVFDKVGLFDERLVRNQDIEFNRRIKKHGGKLYLVPGNKIKYFARNTWRKLWKNNFENGRWVILTAYYTKSFSSLSLRHFVPLFFTLYLGSLPFVCWTYIGCLPLALYLVLNGYFSLRLSLKEKDLRLLPYIFTSFLVLHTSYGLGSMYGLLEVLKKAFKKGSRNVE